MKVLYWDDSDTVLESVAKKLHKLCHKCVPAKTLEECKAALADKEDPVDLFIADYKADEEHGMNYLMGAKANDPELHVIVLTPSILRSDFNQFKMCGIEVLKKPILLDQVVRPYLAPDKRRKKSQPPMPIPPAEGKKVGLLGIAEDSSDDAPAPPPAKADSKQAPERPEGMPPPPGSEDVKKRKGLTRLFVRN